MKINHFIAGTTMFLLGVLTSCGPSSGSASGCFGGIPEILASYEQESDALKEGINKDNYEKKSKEADELKEKTTAEVEKLATELSGKEIACTVDGALLKIDKPVTLVFESMNKYRPVFRLGGDVVAAADLTLNANPGDLGGDALFSGDEIVVTVKMPVAIDFLDKEGNVIEHRNDIGTLEAANDGKTAVVKAGTPIDFCRTFTVNEKLSGVESVRLTVELDKEPYTSRSLK